MLLNLFLFYQVVRHLDRKSVNKLCVKGAKSYLQIKLVQHVYVWLVGPWRAVSER